MFHNANSNESDGDTSRRTRPSLPDMHTGQYSWNR
jgi:hypothetical protein